MSTDAGGEGVNLQFAHVVVNWDLPWTPTLVEQRIGRVDRIGQRVPVRAFSFALEDSVDQRVLEVLESKLAVILRELGVDKRGDVLATVDGLTDSLYVTAILNPQGLDEAGEAFAAATRTELQATSGERAILGEIAITAPKPAPSPVPGLIERLQRRDRRSGKRCTAPHQCHSPWRTGTSGETGWRARVVGGRESRTGRQGRCKCGVRRVRPR